MVKRPAVWIPAVALVAATVLFWCTNLDVELVQPFFSGDKAAASVSARFPLKYAEPWHALYHCGIYPAWILGIGGAVVWVLSFVLRPLAGWRDAALFYALLLLIGPGILVNTLCKPYWHRPRPNTVCQFGGPEPFVPVGGWGIRQEDASFPSGHAAMGFYLMAPAFVFWRRRRRLAAWFLGLGLICGTVMGITRVIGGGHFPSDVLWSGGLVYFTGLALAAFFRFGQDASAETSAQG